MHTDFIKSIVSLWTVLINGFLKNNYYNIGDLEVLLLKF